MDDLPFFVKTLTQCHMSWVSTIGFAEASRRWTSGKSADRLWVREQAQQFMQNQANQLLEQPSLENWQKPSEPTIAQEIGQNDIERVSNTNRSRISNLSDREDQYQNDPVKKNPPSPGELPEVHKQIVDSHRDSVSKTRKTVLNNSGKASERNRAKTSSHHNDEEASDRFFNQ